VTGRADVLGGPIVAGVLVEERLREIFAAAVAVGKETGGEIAPALSGEYLGEH
jgi:hypothetical protein